MDDVKESHQALGASAIVALPGPQFPLYVLGRRLEAIYPIPFLAGERALAVAIMSYDGGMTFGLLGDFDALPDLDVLVEGIEISLAELRRAAT